MIVIELCMEPIFNKKLTIFVLHNVFFENLYALINILYYVL